MSRPAKGARLYLRRGRADRAPIYYIRDGSRSHSTATGDQRLAEKVLAEYIDSKNRKPGGPADAGDFTIAEALLIYGKEHAPNTKDPQRIGYAIAALMPFWRELPVSAITRATCHRYVTTREASDATARRELGTLRAALNYCRDEGILLRTPTVYLPPKPPSSRRVLSRSEIAAMLRAARSDPRTRHIARYILLALTGTRKEALLSLRFEPHASGGWIDVARGVLYRSAADHIETRKRRPPCRLPKRLLSHCRRWARDSQWVITYKGGRIGSIKSAWRKVCQRAGVENAPPHCFRHTAITWAIEAGVPLADAAGYFGVSIATLEKEYLHLHPDFQTATAAAMDRAGRRTTGE